MTVRGASMAAVRHSQLVVKRNGLPSHPRFTQLLIDYLGLLLLVVSNSFDDAGALSLIARPPV